jgi:hypothetical protein
MIKNKLESLNGSKFKAFKNSALNQEGNVTPPSGLQIGGSKFEYNGWINETSGIPTKTGLPPTDFSGNIILDGKSHWVTNHPILF